MEKKTQTSYQLMLIQRIKKQPVLQNSMMPMQMQIPALRRPAKMQVRSAQKMIQPKSLLKARMQILQKVMQMHHPHRRNQKWVKRVRQRLRTVRRRKNLTKAWREKLHEGRKRMIYSEAKTRIIKVTMREIHKLGHLSVTFLLQMNKQIRMEMYLIPMQSMLGIKFCSVNLKRR